MPSSIASRIGGTTALPSLAWTMNAWYLPVVIAFWICETCCWASKLGSKNFTSTPCLAASSLMPAKVAWANEFAQAKPKNAMSVTFLRCRRRPRRTRPSGVVVAARGHAHAPGAPQRPPPSIALHHVPPRRAAGLAGTSRSSSGGTTGARARPSVTATSSSRRMPPTPCVQPRLDRQHVPAHERRRRARHQERRLVDLHADRVARRRAGSAQSPAGLDDRALRRVDVAAGVPGPARVDRGRLRLARRRSQAARAQSDGGPTVPQRVRSPQ